MSLFTSQILLLRSCFSLWSIFAFTFRLIAMRIRVYQDNVPLDKIIVSKPRWNCRLSSLLNASWKSCHLSFLKRISLELSSYVSDCVRFPTSTLHRIENPKTFTVNLWILQIPWVQSTNVSLLFILRWKAWPKMENMRYLMPSYNLLQKITDTINLAVLKIMLTILMKTKTTFKKVTFRPMDSITILP